LYKYVYYAIGFTFFPALPLLNTCALETSWFVGCSTEHLWPIGIHYNCSSTWPYKEVPGASRDQYGYLYSISRAVFWG